MTLLGRFVGGLKALFGRDQRNAEMDEELNGFLDEAAQDRMHRGMNRAAAMRAARAEMGSTESVKQKVHASGWESAAEFLWQDIRYGMRQLIRSPGFSIVALLTLALGIGANTAIFTLVHAVMLKQLPIAHPEKLYRVGEGEYYCCEWGGLQDSWGTFDYPFYKHLRDTNPSFEQIAAFSGNTPAFDIRRANSSKSAQTTNGEYVSGNYFAILGLQPALGRLLQPADDRVAAAAVAVMGYRTWQQDYGADPSIVGSTLLMNGLPVTLVGIAPPGFFGDRLTTNPPELWIPLSQEPAFEGQGQKSLLYATGDAWLYLIGRLKPHVSPAQVQIELSGELQRWLRAEWRLDQEERGQIPKQQLHVVPGGTGISPFRSNSKDGLYLLSAASLLVLLIACANLANLLLARGAAREHQTALRLSLGATRARLIRSVLTESVLLSLIGGALGVMLAYAGSRMILLIVFRGATFVPVHAAPSLAILGFALTLSALTGIVFGFVPAWIGTRADPSAGLRAGNRASTGHVFRPQKVLVIVQAALSILLLATAGLVTRSLRNLESSDLGFKTRGRLLATINFKSAGYKPEQLSAVYTKVRERLEAIPGVRSASLSLNSPQNLCCFSVTISIGGRSEKWIGDVDVLFDRVSSGYFETIGTPLLRGRTFTEDDTPTSARVAVVDEAFAKKFFPGQDPIGQHFGLPFPGHAYDFQIVGVAKNTKYRNPWAVQGPMFFLPLGQSVEYGGKFQRLENGTLYAFSLQLSVSGRPEGYENLLRSAVADVDPNLSLTEVKSYSEQVAVQFNQQRLIARLTGFFSLLALVLASVGLYGVTAYNVTRRTGEIGIRMALGANRGNVVSMVLRGALSQIGIGLCIGIPLALLCGRALAHQLYGVSSFDPLVLGGAILVLCLCATVAGFLPARRAASVEPMEALRIE